MRKRALIGQTLALALNCGSALAAEVYMSADDCMMGSQQERWGYAQGVYDTYGALVRQGPSRGPSSNRCRQRHN